VTGDMHASFVTLRAVCVTALACMPGCRNATAGGADVDAAPHWTLEEELRIGSVDDPDAGFSRVGGLAVDSTGRLFVLDAQERQIRVFDASGQLIRRIGRRGAGPGELEAPFDFGLVGDTLWVSEMGGNQRLTLFSTDGALLGTVNALPRLFTGTTGGVRVSVVPAAFEPGGVISSQHTSTVIGADTVIVPRLRFGLDGNVLDTIGWDTVRHGASGRPRMRIAGVSGPHPGRPGLFYDEPIVTAHSQVRVERRLATSAVSGTFTVTRLNASGDTIGRHAYRYRPLPFSPEQIDEAAAIAGEIFRMRGVDSLVADRELRGALDVPSFLPPVTRVRLVGDELWLRREDTYGRPWRWTVRDRHGMPIGQIALPRTATPRIFESDRIWVVEPDELDVPWVVRYRIVRS
jgi:hypothetical protein